MVFLRIEHGVRDFDQWKAAFDSDPLGRQKMGVRRYRVSRPVDNPSYSIVELEFDNAGQAEALLAAMQQVWARMNGALIQDPRWRISEMIETVEL
jgi:hypothetical protein